MYKILKFIITLLRLVLLHLFLLLVISFFSERKNRDIQPKPSVINSDTCDQQGQIRGLGQPKVLPRAKLADAGYQDNNVVVLCLRCTNASKFLQPLLSLTLITNKEPLASHRLGPRP
jgi:hypothetical protein